MLHHDAAVIGNCYCSCSALSLLQQPASRHLTGPAPGSPNCSGLLPADICKQPVSNLPEVTPRAATEGSVDGQSPFADLDQNGPDTFHGGPL